MLKKRVALVFLITSILATFSFAEDIVNICDKKLDECIEKCATQNSEACEENCEIEFNICLDTADESAPKEISN